MEATNPIYLRRILGPDLAGPAAELLGMNYEVERCEYDDCTNTATLKFNSSDEDGEYYYTLRCDEHPAHDPEYNVEYL